MDRSSDLWPVGTQRAQPTNGHEKDPLRLSRSRPGSHGTKLLFYSLGGGTVGCYPILIGLRIRHYEHTDSEQ
jgi:hypothetical protein